MRRYYESICGCPCDGEFVYHRGLCRTESVQGVPPAARDVLSERGRQDAKWGEQNHDAFTWLAVLSEEVGEAAKAALHDTFGGPDAGKFRHEMIQVAAVAIAIIECLDRNGYEENPLAKAKEAGA